MLPSLIKAWIVVDFEINRKQIAKTLCINKEKPITVCGGSCYLSNQLSKAEEPATKQLPPSVKLKVELAYYVSIGSVDKVTKAELNDLKNIPFKSLPYKHTNLEDIFHPPRQA